jgi:hypothetical protein
MGRGKNEKAFHSSEFCLPGANKFLVRNRRNATSSEQELVKDDGFSIWPCNKSRLYEFVSGNLPVEVCLYIFLD